MRDREFARRLLCLAVATAVLAACATGARPGPEAVRTGQAFVAMGSSFASGPGIEPAADGSPPRCGRSASNYAHLLAATLGLQLTDVSCGGATTRHLLGPWNELPPQRDALTPDTSLVTVTIGGNDVGYIGTLGSASCRSFPAPPPGTPGGRCPGLPAVSAQDWVDLEASLRRIATEVRRRAPRARLVFVDYLTVLPARGGCAAVPLTNAEADASRATAARLAALTARIAGETGAELFKASELSRDHDACSVDPWVSGFPRPGGSFFIPYHPNARGMAAIADALARRLGQGRRSSRPDL